MVDYVSAFLASFGVMTAIDALWLGLIAPKFYKRYLGFIMTDHPNWLAAGLFYIVYVLGVTVFVVYPGWINNSSLSNIAGLGALFGLVAYATYDLTNQATLKNWPAIVTVVDLAWGALLTATVSVLAVIILQAILKR